MMACKRNLWCMIFFFLFSLSYSLTNDTLSQGHTLNATYRLVSANGLFTLGFSGNYLVLNYTGTGADQSFLIDHPLWLANREDPVLENSGVLTLDAGTGALKVVQNDAKQIKTLYPGFGSSKANNITAILQNNGNFVLKEVNSGEILWQSFDDPTDTLLPGMKLGVNKRTGRKWLLTSWLAQYNPKPGGFTLEWDPIQRQIIMKRAGVEFWTSGVLTPDNRFDNLNLLDSFNQNYNFTHISDEDEDYIFYTLHVEEWNVSRWLLDDLGNIQEDVGRRNYSNWLRDNLWNFRKDISRIPFTFSSEACDGNSAEMGCKKWDFGPECRRDGDKFVVLAGSFRYTLKDYGNLSFIDCQNLCWNSCDCTGFSFDSNSIIGSTYCQLNSGPFYYQNLRAGQQDHYIIIPGPPRKVDRTWIWILTSIVLSLIAVFMFTWLYLRCRRLKLEEKFLKELMTDDIAKNIDELQNNGNNNLQIYDAATISAATNGFSSGNRLGEGGFGPVYKGRLSEGQEIAVKRLSSESRQGLVEFKNELILIAKLQHMNLVRLLGFCIQGEDKMLVYEFMPNKSLDFFIFAADESMRKMLDWSKRLNIIDGIAQGLVYLHKYSRLRIIHRDLKASNILLNKDMVPKISDFGLARYFRQNEFEASTSILVGTRGYMPPEYLMEGIFSVKSDVYSFGVLLLEIISGKKNHNVYHRGRPLNLVGYAWELWKDNSILEIVEPSLRISASEDRIRRCVNIGLLCVEQSPLDRPIMSDVLFMLTSEAQQLPMPKQPAFYMGEHIAAVKQSERDMEFQSINDMSISEMDGR
ncbi:G-type lectin S-receptor-like serine/threonine-protein kinase CES101 [Mercurialis annua]|uniref:G-type lectin S-receptor-like serine/threonine-protein kinase CES101 n=1 Tax=Mercurialis annua TaxID=3986 RepID=UPI00215EF6FF|nr:G-type lectin S-receptor-like serine/threonine-protein kinase CES101 [Mercurialis annua]